MSSTACRHEASRNVQEPNILLDCHFLMTEIKHACHILCMILLSNPARLTFFFGLKGGIDQARKENILFTFSILCLENRLYSDSAS